MPCGLLFDDRSIRRSIVVEGNTIACQTWIEGTFVREFTQSPVGPLRPNGRKVVWQLLNIFVMDDQGPNSQSVGIHRQRRGPRAAPGLARATRRPPEGPFRDRPAPQASSKPSVIDSDDPCLLQAPGAEWSSPVRWTRGF